MTDRALAEISLYDFLEQAWPVMQPGVPFVPGWHLEAVCEHLQALFFGEIRNLLINVPPRTTKSVTCCVALPAWGWIHKPHFKYLFASYANSLSVRDSMATRDLVLSDWYQERWGDRVSLCIDKNKQDRFSTTVNGYRLAISVGGSVLGEGADLLAGDDLQNVHDATFSKAVRDRGNNFAKRILATRMNDPKTARRLLVQQRFHQNDVSGDTIERDTRNIWTKLILPMEYERKRSCCTIFLPKYMFNDKDEVVVDRSYRPTKRWEDPRQEEGELLCPERFGPEELAQICDDLELWDRAGQFQQRPAPPGGGMFKDSAWTYFRQVERPTEILRSCQSWDLPVKGKSRSSYMVGQLWVYDGMNYWLIAQRRKRAGYVDQRDNVLEFYREFPWVDAVVIEDKATGPAVIEELRSYIPCIEEYEPEGDKVARAAAISSIQANGHLKLPDPDEQPWVKDDLLAELSVFPNSTYKDQTDTMVQAVRWLKTYGGRLIPRRQRRKARKRPLLVSGL